jgi:hypothetical protein
MYESVSETARPPTGGREPGSGERRARIWEKERETVLEAGRRPAAFSRLTHVAIALVAVAALLTVAVADAPAAPAPTAEQAKKGKKGKKGAPKVKLAIRTGTQAELLQSNSIIVKLRGPAKRKVSLSLRQGTVTGLAIPESAKGSRKGRTVQLVLSEKGTDLLGVCGPQAITVEGSYRAGKKRKTARDSAELAGATTGCKLHVEAPNADRCDPIDLANCLAPFPNDYFTVPDPSTGTGRRVALNPASMMSNTDGVSTFMPELNRNDGFSPNNIIVSRVPGIETPAAFKANDIVPQMDIGKYDDPSQRVLLLNADTGQRHPIWAEIDMVPGTPNPHNNDLVQGTANDRLLMIHPAEALEPGQRYIVVLRGLTDVGGAPLQPNTAFRAYRDKIPTDSPAVEGRRAKMESLFTELGDAGVSRGDLYLTWDFTVASEENLTERLLAMRDDAFGQLGDTNLADDEVQGDSPTINITSFTDFDLCNANGTEKCDQTGVDGFTGTTQSDYVFRKVTGTIEVPCYMNAPGAAYNATQPNIPCGPGSRLHYEAGEDTPSQNGAITWNAPFTCVIPREAENSTEMATGKKGVVFGHGLLQNHRITESLALFPAALEGVACSTDWIGLSGTDAITGAPLGQGDILGYMLNMIYIKSDLSLFSALPDRSQQGYVNMLYLARAMAHPQGFSDEAEFQDDLSEPSLEIDETEVSEDLGYFGVSLGGIFGAATTSVAPDWERAVLSVPGMGFTTLITRSTQFNQFLPPLYTAYPDPLARMIGISMLQLLWDRGDPSAYIQRLTDDPFPNTPSHEVQIHEAFGDHQVTNIQTQSMARTIGADLRTPAIDPARIDDVPYLFTDTVNPYYGLDQVTSAEFNVPGGHVPDSGAVMYTFDTGPLRDDDPGPAWVGTTPNPDWDIAPVSRDGATANNGLDPHEPAATSPSAQLAAIPFLLGEGFYDPCVSGAPGPTVMPPWITPFTGTPEPCEAPPVHSFGQGN